VKQKTGTTLQFDLHTPHGEVCNVSINSVRKDRELGVGPVIIAGDNEDRNYGTIALADGSTWPFEINGVHSASLGSGDVSGMVNVGSEKTTAGIRWPVSFPGLAAPRSAGTGIRPAESTSTVKV
jgi:hypothetical protein